MHGHGTFCRFLIQVTSQSQLFKRPPLIIQDGPFPHQDNSGFEYRWGRAFLCGVCMLSLCLHWFPLGTAVSPNIWIFTNRLIPQSVHLNKGTGQDGHHPPPHQEHAQTLLGVYTGTRGPYTLLSRILSCHDKIHKSWISLWLHFFTDWDFESCPQWVDNFGCHWLLLDHFFLHKLYNVDQ